jgi:hypothetical protein
MISFAIEPEEWGDDETRRALDAAAASGQPHRAVALFARWWQLETWLRELAYVELRARDGKEWTASVEAALYRLNQDAEFTHMTSSDGSNPLAYFDYSKLIAIIGENWDNFGYALLTKASWDGRQDDLMRVRHRIGHMRKPHQDDLGRLEQTLRDLERGAFMAMSSYNDSIPIKKKSFGDAVTKGWIEGEHETARRLVRHAERQYDTSIEVHLTRRRWAEPLDDSGPSGKPGYLWRVNFVIGGSRRFNVAGFWRDVLQTRVNEYLVHMLVDGPWSIDFTFAAVDDDTAVANSIGSLFDMLLSNSRRTDDVMGREETKAWTERAAQLDYRLLVSSGWGMVGPDTVPITLFGAGGGTLVVPG